MSPVAVGAKASLPKLESGSACRVWERFSCHLETQCQPVAARGPNEMTWKARIRDISSGGIGLVAERRFEPGTGLAIQVPSPDDPDGETYLAKVVHVRKRQDGSWFLGLALISRLSDDEVSQIASRGQPFVPTASDAGKEHARPGAGRPSQVIPRVRWRDLATGQSRVANRLLFKGSWPLRERAHVTMRVNTAAGFSEAATVVVHACEREGEEWVIDFSFVHDAGPQVQEWLDEGEPL